ncbi:response regulator transcription factor [Plantactinospora sp. WMMB334]|uniref:response regulator transcription factor n=1 Tax=Plantactinospora sp. WMMB334 TaxID=3404119 RepID=UPI003B95EFAD
MLNGPHKTSTDRRISVFLAVDNVVKRHGVEGIFHSPKLAGYARLTIGCLADLPARTAADFVLVALRELGEQTLPVLDEYRRRGTKVLILLDAFDSFDADNGTRLAGVVADGFLGEAELTADRLGIALACISNGDLPMPATLARDVLDRLDRCTCQAPAAVDGLTPREHQVMSLMVDGLSNKQIARRLGISEHGAKRLVGKILVRLDCPSRTAAVALAMRSGYPDARPAAS